MSKPAMSLPRSLKRKAPVVAEASFTVRAVLTPVNGPFVRLLLLWVGRVLLHCSRILADR